MKFYAVTKRLALLLCLFALLTLPGASAFADFEAMEAHELYLAGLESDMNGGNGVNHYVSAAYGGSGMAMLKLGDFCVHGYGADINVEKALEWYQKAVESDDAAARCIAAAKIGDIYYFGLLGAEDKALAAEWYSRAAAFGESGREQSRAAPAQGAQAVTAQAAGAGLRLINDESQPEEPASAVSYVLNTNTRKFHYPHCSSADDIKPSNRSDFSGSRSEVLARGFEPCGRCRP